MSKYHFVEVEMILKDMFFLFLLFHDEQLLLALSRLNVCDHFYKFVFMFCLLKAQNKDVRISIEEK